MWSKAKKNIKNFQLIDFLILNKKPSIYIIMKDNQWLMMTYYCPTHGSQDRSEPIQIDQRDLKRLKTKISQESELND